MTHFLDALEQAEKARKDKAKEPEQPKPKVNGIGGAAAWALRDQLPEPEQPATESPANGKASTDGKSLSALNSQPSSASASEPRSPLDAQPSTSSKHSAQEKRSPSDSLYALRSTLSPSSLDPHLVSLVSPESFESDQYRTLRHIVEQKRTELGVHVIAVTSPAVGDGKTITSINLAGALAQAPDARVLLIDVDLRRPSISHQLGIRDPARKGIVDAVLDSHVTFDDLVTFYPDYNLSVVSSGPPPSPPYEVLKSPRFGEILQEARARFDFILIDTPPLVPFSDCRLIGKWVDGFLVVVSAHRTPQAQLEEGMNVIDQEKVLGIVFNADDTLAPAKYNYYYKYRRNGRRKWNPFRKKG